MSLEVGILGTALAAIFGTVLGLLAGFYRGWVDTAISRGIRPPTASWGQMISEASPIFTTAWWYMVFPGVALLLTVLAFNLLGGGLLDALNPREESR